MTTEAGRTVVAVVGGGIAGLAAAWELLAGSEHGVPGGSPVVHVLEAADRFGGKLHSAEVAGRTVDLAADAFLARRPEATGLCAELGITDELVPVGASGASILARGRLRPMPTGLNLGVPTRWLPLARSGILGVGGTLRAALDLLPGQRRTGPEATGAGAGIAGPATDRSVADIVGSHLGRAVVEQLADPLIGGINAGGVDDLSAAATFPPLLAAARQGGSLMRALRQGAPQPTTGPAGSVAPAPARAGRPTKATPAGPGAQVDGPTAAGAPAVERWRDPANRRGGGRAGGGGALHTRGPRVRARPDPVFWSLRGGTASLVDRLVDALASRGAVLRTGAAVDRLEPRSDAGRWTLRLGDGSSLAVDGVVLAVPAPSAAHLLGEHAPEAAAVLRSVQHASVAVVTLAIPRGAIRHPLDGTGFLVPRTTRIGGRRALMTGCTYLSRKWPHLGRPDDQLFRVSMGRYGDERPAELDDDELGAAAEEELARVLGVDDPPTERLVTRWVDAFPQYEVGHLERVGQVEMAVGALPGLAVAGATYQGVGIPACIGSGRDAARRVALSLTTAATRLR